MKQQEFIDLVLGRQEICKVVLGAKAVEYAGEEDRLENFKRAAGLQGCTPEQALVGMAAKHFVSIVMGIEAGKFSTQHIGMWDEKITDAINYLHLLEGLLFERFGSSARRTQEKTS